VGIVTFAELKALDETYVMHTYGRFPVDIDHGQGATLYSLSGRKYIDFTSGIGVNSLGYGNPKWMAAITEQIGKLGHISNLFYTQPGTLLAQQLCTRSGMDKVFFGNSGAEANEAMMGTADVIVTDGFTGNVMLKTMEGVGKFLLKSLKEMFLSSTKTKLAAGLVKGDLGQMKKLLDPSEVGGTPFLGIQKPVIKAHGGSNARAIENAVLRAKEYAESGFIADIQANIEHMRVQPGMEKN
jgi:hypothetical protein